jgi:hypothetical protein
LTLLIPTSKPTSAVSPNELAKIAPWLAEPELGLVPNSQEFHKTEQSTALPPTKSKNKGTTEPDPVVKLLVGKQDPHSQYFTPRLFILRSSALKDTRILSEYHRHNPGDVTASSPIKLPDLDPNAFDLYCEYVRTGKIKLSKRFGMDTNTAKRWSWTSCWPLLNAHILSTAICDHKFGKYLLSLLNVMLAHNQAADLDTMRHLFTMPGVSQELKNFVIDAIISNSRDNFSPQQLSSYPDSFVYVALHRAARMLKLGSSPDECHTEGHIDVRSVKCIRDSLQGAVTTKESTNARKEAERDGIDCIDWANRVQGHLRLAQQSPTEDANVSGQVGKYRSGSPNASFILDKLRGARDKLW